VSAAAFIEADWNAPPGVRAVCTTRASLNLGVHVGDAPEAVQENRRRLREQLQLPAEPIWLKQVHGVAVCRADTLAADAPPMTADAAFCTTRAVVCAVMTADCLPIVLASAEGQVVGVAHAGWRGLAGGVIEALIAAMRGSSAPTSVFRAWLGPAIGPLHFEVGDEVRAEFTAQHAVAEAAFVRNAAGRWQCDLYQLARQRLQAAGIDEVSGGSLCTYTDRQQFFSHRRDVQHDRQSTTGRMATLVWRA
jgi:polyphenol oxidase